MAHTVAIFAAFTMFTVTSLAMLSICYVDDREFSKADTSFTGPWGYLLDILYWKAINLIPNTMLLLNNWLADGILVCPPAISGAQAPDIRPSSSSTVATLSTP